MFIRSVFGGKILVQRICKGIPPGFKPIKDEPKKSIEGLVDPKCLNLLKN